MDSARAREGGAVAVVASGVIASAPFGVGLRAAPAVASEPAVGVSVGVSDNVDVIIGVFTLR